MLQCRYLRDVVFKPPYNGGWHYVRTQFIEFDVIRVLGAEIFRRSYGRTREAKTRFEGCERPR